MCCDCIPTPAINTAASAAAAATAGKKMMMITGKSSSRNMSMKMWSGSFEHLREVNRSTKRA